jgi:hypothetical protein
MSDGTRILTTPRHNPVNAYTMGGIARDAGLSVEEFKKLLYRSSRLGATVAAGGHDSTASVGERV